MLNRLGTSLAGGAKVLSPELAEQAILDGVARPLGLDLEKAASAVLQVANANMADAVRLISIRRGYDRRDFALVAFGGAGALHGAEVARELSIPTVIVPPHPGVTSALGCLLVDIRHDLSAMLGAVAHEADEEEFENAFAGLEAEATARLRHEGVAPEDAVLQRLVSMRYLGQWRSLTVRCGTGPGALAEAVALFHEQHEREYAFRRDDTGADLPARPDRDRHHAQAGVQPGRGRAGAGAGAGAAQDPRGLLRRRGLGRHAGARARRAARRHRSDRPGDHRPAGRDHGGPAGGPGRGRRVAEHPDPPDGGLSP